MQRLAGAIILLLLLPGGLFAQGIPIEFSLERSGYLTIVIEEEDADGDLIRVRNLIQDEFFSAGDHVIYWDGYGMGEPVRNHHARYDLIEHPVQIGEYRVRALFHEGVDLKYQFSVYQPGHIPWQTSDPSSGWLGEHGPAVGVAFLPNGIRAARQPLLAITSVSGEVYRNTAYVNLDGKKVHGNHPGHYIMHHVTVDRGPKPERRYDGYTVTDIKEGGQPLARVHGFLSDPGNSNDTHPIAGVPIDQLGGHHLGGLAAWNGFVFVSLPSMNKIGVINATNRAFVGYIDGVEMPVGIEFAPDGSLYVAQGENREGASVPPRITRYTWNENQPTVLAGAVIVVQSGLEAPQQIRFHQGEMYVSDAGYRPNTGHGAGTAAHHQVKVFDPANGSLRRTIGKPGGPQWGRYDENRMHNPRGFDIDSRGRLWVAEFDYAPRRVSIWDAKTGAFVRAIYGNSKYAGGGTFDPTDATRMFYSTPTNDAESVRTSNETIEFFVDWDNPENSRPNRILWRQAQWDPHAYSDGTFFQGFAPEHPHVVDGQLYLTNWHQNGGGREPELIGIWKYDDATERLRLVSVIGAIGHEDRSNWPRLNDPDLHPLWNRYHGAKALVSWTDLNGDGEVQPSELQFKPIYPGDDYHSPYQIGPGSIATDLTYTSAMGLMIKPRFTGDGLPVFHLDDLVRAAMVPAENRYGGDGAQSVAYFPEHAFAMHFGGPLTGYRMDYDQNVDRTRIHDEAYGKMVWQYHVQTPSSSSSVGADYFPRYSGDIHRMMRYINAPLKVDRGEAGEIVAISAYHGSVHLMTHDGFYLTDIGADSRIHGNWMDVMGPGPWRGRSTQNRGLRGESYFHSLSRLDDGRIVFQGGGDTNLFLVEGLETARRFNFGSVNVTAEDFARIGGARETQTSVMENREMRVYLNSTIQVDGDLSDWQDSLFVEIDRSRSISAALASDGEYLFAAWKTHDPRMLNNPQTNPLPEVFRAGGGLDIFIASSTDIFKGNPTGVPYPVGPRIHRKGDQRIFITKNGDPDSDAFRVYLFEKVNPRAASGEGHTYYSPIFPNGISYARAVDISDQVIVRQNNGDFEVGIPMQALDKMAWPGKKVLGDIGVVIGNGDNAISRSYWNNSSRIMTNDLPTEAEWWTAHMGVLHFVSGNTAGVQAPSVRLNGNNAREINGQGTLNFSTLPIQAGVPVARVEYWANYQKIGEAGLPPYAFTWEPETGGEYVISARAFGSNGMSTFSKPDTVTIWRGLPEGWANRDITKAGNFGYDGLQGDAAGGGTTLSVTGTGKFTVANGGTNHHFVYRKVQGDFDLQTVILGPHQSTSHNAEGGITVRANLEFDSPHAMVIVSRLGTINAWNRSSLTDNSRISPTSRQLQFPIYVRIQRVGGAVSTFYSANGSNWELASTENVALGEDAYVGIIMSNGDAANGSPQTFRFDTTRLNGELVGEGPTPGGSEPAQRRVSIMSPRAGEAFKLPATVVVEAEALAQGEDVEKVVFRSGDLVLGTVYRAPYRFEWENPPEGEHFLTARAYLAGQSNPLSSSAVRIVVEHNRNVDLPRPWNQAQIGEASLNGGAEAQAGRLVVWGTGSGFQGSQDGATFIYQPNAMEVEISAQVTDYSELGREGFVGLMAREQTEPGAAFAAIWVDGDGNITFAYRDIQDRNTATQRVQVEAGSRPWLKLERSGSRFAAFVSADGSEWHEAGSTILPVPPRAKIGIAIGSSGNDDLARATLQQVDIAHVQSIPLEKGWNLVSSWVDPTVTSLSSIAGPLGGSIVVMKNGNGDVFIPEHNIDQIQNWSWQNGYSLYVTEPGSIRLKGRKLIPESDQVPLTEGWNVVPFTLSEEVAAGYALRHISDHVVLLKDIKGNVYIPAYGINTIGNLIPGRAYQLFSTQEAVLAYPAYSEFSGPAAQSDVAAVAPRTAGSNHYFTPDVQSSAYSATLILHTEHLADGDEIAVRTEAGEIVGAGVVTAKQAIIPVFGRGTDPRTAANGAEEGEVLEVYAWSASTGDEVFLDLRSITDLTGAAASDDQLKYRSNAFWVAEGFEKPSEFYLGQNYPNPFNPSTTIQYSVPIEMKVNVTVYNMLGQAVATLVDDMQRAGEYTIRFDGSALASGVYVYQIRAGSFRETRKMTLVK